MKRSVMLKWVKRLESPRSRQARNRLRSKHDPKAMCCLGHLCAVLGFKFDKWGFVISPEGSTDPTSAKFLPDFVAEKAGMQSRTGIYGPDGPDGPKALVQANDDLKLSLPEIAKIIRKHWREL